MVSDSEGRVSSEFAASLRDVATPDEFTVVALARLAEARMLPEGVEVAFGASAENSTSKTFSVDAST